MTARQTTIQHSGYGVNGNREWKGNINKNVDPFRRRNLFAFCGENNPATEDVQQQVSPEYTHIPEKHGMRCGKENYIEASERLAEHRGLVARELAREASQRSGGEILGTSEPIRKLREEQEGCQGACLTHGDTLLLGVR